MGKLEKTLLIVDDEVAALVIFESYFLDCGYQVQIASSGLEALEILEAHSFSVILSDLAMPEMDGLALCREIRKRGIQSTIIAITGHPDKFEFSACRDAGFDGYFSKPVDMDVLLNAVEEAV